MNQPKAFATFKKTGEYVYRTSTYIQWGHSSRSLGSCLLLNPGSATLFRERPAPNHNVMGELTLDPTMRQLIRLSEEIYHGAALDGRLHIYNLFSLQNPKSLDAIALFEKLVETGETTLEEQIAPTHELEKHPWMLLGWGCLTRGSWRHFSALKKMWKQQIASAGIHAFGKRCSNGQDYYHPCPQLYAMREAILRDLVVLHGQTQEKISGKFR
jgi:hypothetical protein